MTYGLDWSAGGFVTVATLEAAERPVVFGYAVSDVGPAGRGMAAEPFADYLADRIEVGLYWEGSASWMLGGYAAGVAAGRDFAANLARIGAPPTMPGFFAHDIDPDPSHFSAIDACLNGIADALPGGWAQVGAYGGWLLIDYLAGGGTVKYLAQTSAWEYGRGVHPAACLYQYGYNAFFDGVNCDLIVTLKDDFGQASRFLHPAPPPKPVTTYPAIAFPEQYARAEPRENPSRFKDADGKTWYPQRGNVTTIDDTVPRIEGRLDAPAAGPHVPKGAKMALRWAFRDGDGHAWYVNHAGYWPGSQFEEIVKFPGRRKPKA